MMNGDEIDCKYKYKRSIETINKEIIDQNFTLMMFVCDGMHFYALNSSFFNNLKHNSHHYCECYHVFDEIFTLVLSYHS